MSMDTLHTYFPTISKPCWLKLEQFAFFLREWNDRINLISRRDITHLESRHFAGCLAPLSFLKLKPGAQIMDVGTGGGLPGLVLAICYPHAQFLLMDSTTKKIRVIADIAERLHLQNVRVLAKRVEEVDGTFDFITGRSVTALPQFIQWVKKNVKRGHSHSIPNGVLYWKGDDFKKELQGIRPQKIYPLERYLPDPFFKTKFILHFSAEELS